MPTSPTVFDSHIADWMAEQHEPWNRLKYTVTQANLARHLLAGTLAILDAGGGNGADSLPLALAGHAVTIADYSQKMLAVARRRAAELGVGARVATHTADLLRLGELFPQPQFDVMLCHNVLQYLDDAPALLGALAATLKPGGLLSIISMNRYGAPYSAACFGNDLNAAYEQLDQPVGRAILFDTPVCHYSADEITALLPGAGCAPLADYGIRCLYDYWGDNERKRDPATHAQLERLELALTDRHPYKLLARFFQVVARKA
ncbi:MAG: methyltransferase domain-containing protein [Chloroflexales bacterium]|nr:methyltransferase domain-containing protein [Chloroflexales bacterium]